MKHKMVRAPAFSDICFVYVNLQMPYFIFLFSFALEIPEKSWALPVLPCPYL